MVFLILIFLIFSLNCLSYEYWLSASAHARGGYQTNWRTDVSILNSFNEEANVKVYFLESGMDKSAENISRQPKEIKISPGSQLKIDDILFSLFGIEQGSGALLFSSEKKLKIISRTYNQLPDKEYGQFIPGFSSEEAKEKQILTGAISSQYFRTNFGILNPSKEKSANINLKFLSKDGILIKEVNLNLDPWVHVQYNEIFSFFGLTPQEDVTLLINSSIPVFCYLSIVDNISSDPIFIPGLL